jgi:hypothetical protein
MISQSTKSCMIAPLALALGLGGHIATQSAYALLGLRSHLTLAALGQKLGGNESAGLRIEVFRPPFTRLPPWAIEGKPAVPRDVRDRQYLRFLVG